MRFALEAQRTVTLAIGLLILVSPIACRVNPSATGSNLVWLRENNGVDIRDSVRVSGPIARVTSVEALPEVFTVHVSGPDGVVTDGMPAVSGDYHVLTGGVVEFVPSYPLQEGMSYRARFEGEAKTVEQVFSIPAVERSPSADVAAIYPSASTLPENQLKFYIHFSEPMSRGQAYERVTLRNVHSGKVDAAFLELGEELWNPKGTRFTLYLDPARVKRELRPHEELGPVLRRGQDYVLEVDASWEDANGVPLRSSYRKEFTVASPDYGFEPLSQWHVSPPRANSQDALKIRLPEPLDRALLESAVWVVQPSETPDGEREISGEITVSEGETLWTFVPTLPWTDDPYAVVVESILEDHAGNSVARPFEVDIFEKVDQKLKVETVDLPFRPTAD